MARRGVFAEMQHQAKLAAKQQEKENREAERLHKAAVRRAEQARKAEERAAKQLAKANEAERKRLLKEEREAHVAAMQAKVEELNSDLALKYEEIDSLLAATLEVDDFVDLNTLKKVVEHPEFDRTDLEQPIPRPAPIVNPMEPTLTNPPAPKGLQKMFGKKKHERALASAAVDHERKIAKWKLRLKELDAEREAVAKEHRDAEERRLSALERERTRYAVECKQREEEVKTHNSSIDTLMSNLSYGAVDAVEEYLSVVLSNSVYPADFIVDHEFTFDAKTAELKLRVLLPGPEEVPAIKTYKYTKSTDEITSTELSQKARKDRYSAATDQVALRSIHEVFEADRRAIVKTISLEVGTETINPATGKNTYVPFVAVGAERDSFLELDLSNVVPPKTLAHLGAAVSKNPFGLVAADVSGIRKS